MEEVVLSDIHVTAESHSSFEAANAKGYKVCFTRFHFFQEFDNSKQKYDEDGDLVVVRRDNTDKKCVIITHNLATKICDVGLQVWPGCLLLCDYVLANPQMFEHKTVLELGAGVGMLSVVMATTAKQVIATDIGDDILELCSANLAQNAHLYKEDHSATVRELDWLNSELKEDEAYGWTQDDLTKIKNVDVIVAADVIYDDHLTEAFFKVVTKLLKQPNTKTFYLTVEKRLNFLLEEMDVASKAYNHFRKCLKQLIEKADKDNLHLSVSQMSTDFHQSFPQYNKTEYLELWAISSVS